MAQTPKTPGTAVVNWDEELARDAAVAAGVEASSGGGQFFSTRAGTLSFDGTAFPNNEMVVIILDSLFENVYYQGTFDPNNPAAPICFAFGRDGEGMAPHQAVVDKGQEQHAECAGCPHLEWASADQGRGKACRQIRRLACIMAENPMNGAMLTRPEDFQSGQIVFLKVPVMSVKAWASYVKNLAGTLNRPPHGVATRVRLVPDPRSQFRIEFELVDKVPNAIMSVVMKRVKEARATIDFPYNLDERVAPARPQSRAPMRSGPVAAQPATRAPGRPAPAQPAGDVPWEEAVAPPPAQAARPAPVGPRPPARPAVAPRPALAPPGRPAPGSWQATHAGSRRT